MKSHEQQIHELASELDTLRAQVESLQSALDANTAAFDLERAERIKAQSEAAALAEMIERIERAHRIGLMVGDGAAKAQPFDIRND